MRQLAISLFLAMSGLAVAVPASAQYGHDHHRWHHCHRYWHHHHWERICR